MSAWRTLPTLRQLTARVRELNEAFAHPEGGPGSVCLYWEGNAVLEDAEGRTRFRGHGEWVCGTQWAGWLARSCAEEVPGQDDFDAVACARRLLADARAKGYK